ncbi:hypothetical protein [Tropicimonas marinistellae]|uniref:hypothetical protein n=1 Tax=Tropicimonas marinistellae TaxID=1739787 RepID=UPI00082EB270|nr:hypothetical protein [Tropicimonas marinistellae]
MSDTPANCTHEIPGRVGTIDETGCTADDQAVLQIARLFFRSFSAPHSHSWLGAFPLAERTFTGRQPERVGVAVLNAVQAMGRARTSGFNFASPDCPICAQKITEHERQFLSVLMEQRAARPSGAHVNAMLLCEGNDTREFLDAMSEVCALLAFPGGNGWSAGESRDPLRI